jgi:hypothetical protein
VLIFPIVFFKEEHCPIRNKFPSVSMEYTAFIFRFEKSVCMKKICDNILQCSSSNTNSVAFSTQVNYTD